MMEATKPPVADLPAGARVVKGPERVGSEQRWSVELPDGTGARLGRLLPELARDESLRRRYVRDLERMHGLRVEGVAPVLELGPQPDPRDPGAPPPWRLRADPAGETLEAWLAARAPAPIDEVAELVARVAEIVHRVHATGAVLRDLHPRWVVLGSDGQTWLTDVGLARVDILSTRTAASLILEGSPYASPEQLRRTTLDQRSDLFALGVILYQALTGQLPYGDGPALLRDASTVLSARQLRPEIPESVDALITACLADDPRARPESAAALAHALRGDGSVGAQSLARVVCQSCGARLRVAQRLCLSCGKLAVQFEHARAPERATKELVLTKASEETEYLAGLRAFLGSVSANRLPSLDFVIGDQRMYSKTELARRIKLPVALFTDLDEETAEALRVRMASEGFVVKVRDKFSPPATRKQRRVLGGLGVGLAVLVTSLAIVAPPVAAISTAAVGGIGWLTAYLVMRSRRKKGPRPGMLTLRAAPAALPASDPHVARLAALLTPSTPEDVREQVGELALLVQRLVDHREHLGQQSGAPRAELEMVTEPVEALVGLVEREVRGLTEIDADLATLDEGKIVRALAASEARAEPRARRDELLGGLDRLRGLEDRRARAFHRLLEASSLLRRAVDLGLRVSDPEAEHARSVQLALHALGGHPSSED